MTHNESTTDRTLRAALAAALVIVSLWLGITSTAGLLLLVPAAVLAVTAAIGFCPLYALLGVSTCPVDRHARRAPARAGHGH